jgi:molecular chaperone HscB
MPMPLKKPNTENYFVFYGLQAEFNIDETLLKNLFLEKSKEFHPDFYTDDAESQHIAVSVSSYNNLAYKILKNPISRASHLLDIMTTNQQEKPVLPNDFLMDMMLINEEIDDMTPENQYELEDKINDMKDDLSEDIEQLANAKNWPELRMAVLKWKYLERLENRFNDL